MNYDWDLIEKMVVDGKKLSEIAEHYGVPKSTLQNRMARKGMSCRLIRIKHGLPANPFVPNGDVNWQDEKTNAKLNQMVRDNVPVSKIAKHFGVKERALRSAIHKYTCGILRARAYHQTDS